MYCFTNAALMNCHKFSGLKQYKPIILNFLSSEIRNKTYRDKYHVISRAAFLLEALGENLLPASRGILHFLACGPFLHVKMQHSNF